MAKVIVAMSGGVDSSVAAFLLKKDGHDVVGITMRLFTLEECNNGTVEEARKVADQIGVEHHKINLSKEFEEEVIKDFVKEYENGHTPNPCVKCNKTIKFGYLLQQIDNFEADYLATGHYARISGGNLFKGKDERKDQSYFLYGIKKENLSKIMFPVGNLTKDEVRSIAVKENLVVAKKPESQEICFIPDNDYPSFLKKHLDKVRIMPGLILDIHGKEIGAHKGLPFYTIGQRRGIDVAGGEPKYVIKIDVAKNSITVGDEKDLEKGEVEAGNLNWLSETKESFKAKAKIRYNMAEISGKGKIDGDKVYFKFDKPVRAVTPGQSIVFYDGDKVLGGGIIA
ncbi:MAG: tRNA-specific 2-thiouridylase MnmA [candidate division CPR2 bacterium GW2011_GWC1_39_9]|uniref:tRNA-specific 2-thiouridylase MnmA n=1 Tax=candidate division CPR2 bacterium GW2011_GWC2_39_10 TaxID=1618345 RepID=A0A0G0M095_UNCC2|nr:MAG: tRNA-specific 2-thiouridylase MnmA [candidate division CPR2 bacterium GW2011_GWC2_39_10]KKR33672.1 MAG: tRNA-specific 2-thiouridylase MnmA [candidate division CPR2 bacterium GW2011_GWC1_39_9]